MNAKRAAVGIHTNVIVKQMSCESAENQVKARDFEQNHNNLVSFRDISATSTDNMMPVQQMSAETIRL